MASDIKPGYIPTLDGLRAVAIMLVIFSHCFDWRTHPLPANLGHVGVFIFFALSGFLITTRLLDEFYKTGRISIRNFYVRRIFRILPPSLLYLGILSILTYFGIVVCSWPAIRGAALLYYNYAPSFGEFGWKVAHFWSLCVEEHFYLFWPCVLIWSGVRRGWRTAASLAMGISVWRMVDDRYGILSRVFDAPFLRYGSFRTDIIADTLLWGCCLAFYFRSRDRNSSHEVVSTVVAIVALVVLVLVSSGSVNHITSLAHFLPTILLGAIVCAPQAPIGRFLELAPLRFIGRLSYSLYLWQQFFMGGPGWHMPFPLALVATLICAYISYTIVEQPSIRFGRRFLAHENARVVASERSMIDPNPLVGNS